MIRNLIGAFLQPTLHSASGPRIVLATPPGERHEMGLMMAALTVIGAGGNCLYLGADLPVEDMAGAVRDVGAAALVVSLVTLRAIDARRTVDQLDLGLEANVSIWIGGPAAAEFAKHPRVEYIASLGLLEERVAQLRQSEPVEATAQRGGACPTVRRP